MEVGPAALALGRLVWFRVWGFRVSGFRVWVFLGFRSLGFRVYSVQGMRLYRDVYRVGWPCVQLIQLFHVLFGLVLF